MAGGVRAIESELLAFILRASVSLYIQLIMDATLNTYHGIQKIVSGGQTGVDRAALDVAIDLEIPHGGWCPKGRLAEDGTIDEKYALTEMESRDYAKRTKQNVVDSDGTLILYRERLQGGTLLTHRLAKEHDKPLHRVRLDLAINYAKIIDWIVTNRIVTLNVAGPRASASPGIEQLAAQALKNLFLSTPQLPCE